MTSPQIDYFLVWILGESNSTGSRIIPYYGRKSTSKVPDPIGIRFDPSGRISRVIMEVGPHLDLATFTPFKVFLRPGLLSRGVNVYVLC